MSVVVTTVAGDDATGMLEAHVRFHLSVGADVVIVSTGAAGAGDPLEPYVRDGRVRVEDGLSQTDMARLAVAEHGAEWVIPSRADEFWWPRGESLRDVLAVIPPRYSIVQALIRTFVASAPKGESTFEELTARTSLLGPPAAGRDPRSALRPVYRAEPEMVVDESDPTLRGRRVPLRAWYPLEVFRVPTTAERAVVDDARVEALLADGTLARDTRLRDALRNDAIGPTIPTIVDDASYAIECAAVGEVDLVRLDTEIRELELRIAALEAGFWPRVFRRLSRLTRSRSGS
jgi:hypothetical protein